MYNGIHYWKTQCMELPKRHVGQGCTDFPKIKELPQNSRDKTLDTKQVPN